MLEKSMRLRVTALMVGVLAAVGLLVVVLYYAQPAEATFPGKNGKIAYVGGDLNIYTINPGGRGKFRVTDNRTRSVSSADTLSWSPNGKRIAYTGYDGHDSEIYTISATGGSRFNVTNNKTYDLEPSYSPDGKKIAYLAYPGRGEASAQKHDSEIYTINVGGGDRAQVTNDHRWDYEPDYSPNGNRIAYASAGLTYDYNIFTINVGGGGKAKLTNTGWARDPSYSPNGKKIAYTDRARIFTINAGGGGRVKVTNNNRGGTGPSYSPDGKKIAYSGGDGHDSEIYTIKVTGGKPFQVTHNRTYDVQPSWGSRP